MAKKRKDHRPAPASPQELKAAAVRARDEGRFQKALDLAHRLVVAEPTPENRQLLRDVSLGHGRQLREQGYTRDAANTFEAALRLAPDDPDWRQTLAAEVARCGEADRAVRLLGPVPPTPEMLGHLADAALSQEGAAPESLLPALRDDFGAAREGFRLTEAGQDEAAREALQRIGLRSPFLEWKVLLRGLLAYYQGDDARAVENWQRLDPKRVPARLAAPFRAALDPAYRAAQAPALQAALQAQFDRLQGAGVLPRLRALRAALEDRSDTLAEAFRRAESLLPALRQEAPHLVPRLASCFYWAVLETGPDDILRYQRVFAAPPEDPNFHRLRGLAHDRNHNHAEAHKDWQLYEKDLAARPGLWPAAQVRRARALIWQHLGDNAAKAPTEEDYERLPGFLGGMLRRPPRLAPSAEKCYQNSLELEPDLLEAHEALVHHLREEGTDAKLEKAARALLAKFPDHADTLEILAEARLARDDPAEALALFQRALQHEPLRRRLRVRVATAHLANARALLARSADEARAHYQAGLNLAQPGTEYSFLARWAVGEWKAGDAARADELLAQARAQAPGEVPVAFVVVTEAYRVKLPPAMKKRLEGEFTAALAGPVTGASAAAVVLLAGALRQVGASYHGFKTHLKKALAYATQARNADFTERQLVDLCYALRGLGAPVRTLRAFTDVGRERFPDSPYFPYLEALTFFRPDGEVPPAYQVKWLLEHAQRLARAAPPDEMRDHLLADVAARLKAVEAMDPMAAMGFFDRFFDPFGDDEDDDEDDRPRRRR